VRRKSKGKEKGKQEEEESKKVRGRYKRRKKRRYFPTHHSADCSSWCMQYTCRKDVQHLD